MIIQSLSFTDARWDIFVKKNENANIFSSPFMNEVFERSKKLKIFPLFAIENDEIMAAVFPVLVKTNNYFPQRPTSRLILYSSPIYQNNPKGIEGVKILLNCLKELAQQKALFLEIRNSEKFPVEGINDILINFEYIPYQNYLIDLSVGPEAIWQSFSTYTRNHINKAKKNNVEIKHVKDKSAIESFELIKNLYHSKNIPLFSKKVFIYAVNELIPRNILQVINAEYEGKIIGTRWGLAYGNILYDWYAGTDYNYGKMYPNELLSWKMMEWGAKNGYKIFDFGGAGIKGKYYGPAKFKEKFHGKLVEYGRYRYISHPFIYRITSKLYDRITEKNIR